MADAVTVASPTCDALIAAMTNNVSYFLISQVEAIALLNEVSLLPKMRSKLNILSTNNKFGPPFSIKDIADNFSTYSGSILLSFDGIPIKVV